MKYNIKGVFLLMITRIRKKLIQLLIILSFFINSAGIDYTLYAKYYPLSGDTLRPVAAALSIKTTVPGEAYGKNPKRFREDIQGISLETQRVILDLFFTFSFLENRLNDNNLDIRQAAAAALAEIARSGPELSEGITTRLFERLNDSERSVRQAAAAALADITRFRPELISKGITTRLFERLNDSNWSVRKAAAAALAEIAGSRPELIFEGIATRLFERLNDSERSVRQAAATALAEIARSGPESPEDIATHLFERLNDSERSVRQTAAAALAEIARSGPESSEDITIRLFERLDDSERNVRQAAATALAEITRSRPELISEGIATRLFERLDDSERSVRQAAATALAEIARPRPEFIFENIAIRFFERLNDNGLYVCQAAATALAEIARSRPELIFEGIATRLFERLNDNDLNIRQAAATALAEITRSRPELIFEGIATRLFERLNDNDLNIRQAAATALAEITRSRPELISEGIAIRLFERLNDSERNVRQAAATALAEITRSRPELISEGITARLFESLNDSNWPVCQAAATALAEITRSRPEIIFAGITARLFERLNDKDLDVRQAAATALAEITRSRPELIFEGIATRLFERLNDSNLYMRQVAATALAEIARSRPELIFEGIATRLFERLNDSNWPVRQAAATALAEIAKSRPELISEGITARLFEGLNDSSWAIRQAAATALVPLSVELIRKNPPLSTDECSRLNYLLSNISSLSNSFYCSLSEMKKNVVSLEDFYLVIELLENNIIPQPCLFKQYKEADDIKRTELIKEWQSFAQDLTEARRDFDPLNDLEKELAFGCLKEARKDYNTDEPLSFRQFERALKSRSRKFPKQPELARLSFPLIRVKIRQARVNRGKIRPIIEGIKSKLSLANGGLVEYIFKKTLDKQTGLRSCHMALVDFGRSLIKPDAQTKITDLQITGMVREYCRIDANLLTYLNGFIGIIGKIISENPNNIHAKKFLQELVVITMLKTSNEALRESILSYSETVNPEDTYSLLEGLLNLYTDSFPDKLKDILSNSGRRGLAVDWYTKKDIFMPKDTIAILQKEFDKIEKEGIEQVEIELIPAKQNLDLFYSNISKDCLGGNEGAIYEKDFYLYRIVVKGALIIAGYVYLAERTVSGKKIWLLPGIQPGPGLSIDEHTFLISLFAGLTKEAKAKGIDLLLLPKDSSYQSNREAIKKAIKIFLKEGKLKKYSVEREIAFPNEGSPQFFDKEFIAVWERGKEESFISEEEPVLLEKADIKEDLLEIPTLNDLTDLMEFIRQEADKNNLLLPTENQLFSYLRLVIDREQALLVRNREGKVVAFCDWWLVDGVMLEKIKNIQLSRFIPDEISSGENIYIPSLIIQGGTNGRKIAGLFREYAVSHNQQALTISGHRIHNSRRRFHIQNIFGRYPSVPKTSSGGLTYSIKEKMQAPAISLTIPVSNIPTAISTEKPYPAFMTAIESAA
jgi:HEAT repeat protein/hemolysin-activating ACP:hemolysin acyltransferase